MELDKIYCADSRAMGEGRLAAFAQLPALDRPAVQRAAPKAEEQKEPKSGAGEIERCRRLIALYLFCCGTSTRQLEGCSVQ